MGESQSHSHQRSSFSESFKLSYQDIPLTTRPSWPPEDFLGSSLIRSRRLTLTCWRTWWRERRGSCPPAWSQPPVRAEHPRPRRPHHRHRAFEATLAEHEVHDLQGERGKGRHLGL